MKQTFDLFLKQIDENENLSSDVNFLKDILESIVHLNDKDLCDSSIINHRIWFILRDFYLNLFQQWRYGKQLDEISCSIFESISNLFLKISSQISEENLSFLKEILLHESILNEINRFLEDLSITNKYLEDLQMKTIDNLFRSIQRLERFSFDQRKEKISFFDNIVKCICSKVFLQTFSQSINNENKNNFGEKFLLITCTDYIYSHSIDQQHKQSLIDIRQSILLPFTKWIHEQSAFYRSWNNRILLLIRQISFLLTLSIQFNRTNILEKDIFDCYCQLIDSFINILYSILHTDNKQTQSLIGTLIPNLYTMTLSNQLEKYLQNKHINSLILKLTTIENDEIQLNAFKILSSITTEQNTKDILYSNQIAKILLSILQKLIDDSNQTLRFYNLIRCLKNLIQYDQIKDEFLKENGLELILRCATETKFQPIQVQQPALEILFAFSFNKQAFQQMKNHIQQLKICLSSSHQTSSNLAQAILWKLENEEQQVNKVKIENQNSKYDFIFSYSPLDIEFCQQICEKFTNEDYRISFEQTENIDEKCHLIDSSDYLLVCISQSYKQDLFCRCELTYAFARQCQIIPLILIANYRPDGWLNRIISGKISIDFTKLNFDVALRKLKSEIDRQKKFIIKPNPPIQAHVQISNIEKSNISFSEIDQWTNEDVKRFLLENNFDVLFPLFNQMNGQLLFELYQMCLNNRESMFHTLKTELANLNSSTQPLTLLMYLRFLNEIQKYISTFVIDQK